MPAPTPPDVSPISRRTSRPALRVAALLCAAAAVVLTAACGSDSKSPTAPSDVTGVYHMTSYLGSPLPYTEIVADTLDPFIYITQVTLNSASITLADNHTFDEALNARFHLSSNDPSDTPQDTTLDEHFLGTYAVDGTTLRMLSTPDTMLDGRIHVDTLRGTIANKTITFADTTPSGIQRVIFTKP